MKPLSLRSAVVVSVALATVMVATRVHHFGTALHLPDASMAVFFLGGLYVRRHLAFAGLLALAVLVDWASISFAGVSDFCITPAYSFLLPAYAVLWYGARLHAGRVRSTAAGIAAVWLLGLACATASFAISNGAFYWLGGRYPDPNVAEYLSRAWQWGPLFVRTTLVYLGVALAAHAGTAWALRGRVVADGAGV